MPGPANRNLKDDVTYWPPASQNQYGERTFSSPVVLKGRWQQKVQLVRAGTGEEVTSMAQVFLSADVIEGGWLAQGDVSNVNDPQLADDAAEVKAFTSIRDLRSMNSERVAFL